MIRSIATVSLGGSLDEKIDAVAAAGYDGLEIFENDLVYYNLSPDQVGRTVREAGLEIVAFQPFRDFEGMPPDYRQRNLDRAERKFDVMEQLGTSLLLVCSNVSSEALDDPERAADDLRELAERAQRRGLRVGFEALAWGRFIHDYQQAWDVVQRGNHPNLGIILDTFHMLARRCRIEDIKDISVEKIFLVQVADAPAIDMDILQWSRHYRCFPGQGELPVIEVMQTLAAIGYQGAVSHEIFNDNFRAAPPQVTAVDGIRSLYWLDEQIRGSRPEPAPATAPDRRVAGRGPERPLEVPVLSGIEFIEFAAFGDSPDQVRKLLQALGFRRTHTHRSKAVTLYRQGGINIVLNEEPDSFARSFYVLHGISVCAIALRVPDAGRAYDRAKAYRGKPFIGSIKEGELEIPAIRGVGDSLIYFVDRHGAKGEIYDVDFVADAQIQKGADLGLNRIDHLGQAVAPTEFLSWILCYKAILGLEFEAHYDLTDPYGIIVSRAMVNPDRSVRIALNASQSGLTSTARFLGQYQGSGVQQIAFQCSDIFYAAENVGSDIILEIPSNYYDDLAAKHAIDAALLERMRSRNILYDRNDGGEFFHFYTKSINGIFFEVLERRNYDRYGEINTPVRLASQAKLTVHPRA